MKIILVVVFASLAVTVSSQPIEGKSALRLKELRERLRQVLNSHVEINNKVKSAIAELPPNVCDATIAQLNTLQAATLIQQSSCFYNLTKDAKNLVIYPASGLVFILDSIDLTLRDTAQCFMRETYESFFECADTFLNDIAMSMLLDGVAVWKSITGMLGSFESIFTDVLKCFSSSDFERDIQRIVKSAKVC